MSNMLLGISPEFLYIHGKQPKLVSDFHKPYFLAFCPKNRDINTARKDLLKKIQNNTLDNSALSKIDEIGEIENYRSFSDFKKNRKVFKVYTKRSYFVPEVSDSLFFYHNLYTAEHDIPYHQRALVDLAAEDKTWVFDTNSEKKKLKVLIYDIETTEFEQGKTNIPIDIIGFSDFDIAFESSKNLDDEHFSFNILDCPSSWEDTSVEQLMSRNLDEEVDNLFVFCKKLMNYDIISGHNILGFDNLQIYHRISWILRF